MKFFGTEYNDITFQFGNKFFAFGKKTFLAYSINYRFNNMRIKNLLAEDGSEFIYCSVYRTQSKIGISGKLCKLLFQKHNIKSEVYINTDIK